MVKRVAEPLNAHELVEQSEADLQARIADTLSRRPMLAQVYDDNYRKALLRRRRDPDNYLLWTLASHQPAANHIVARLEECLNTLRNFDVLRKFGPKLRQHETSKFKSVLTELQVPANFAERGFRVQFEPSLAGTLKSPDFKSYNHLEVYFEITNLFDKERQRVDKVKAELWKRFRRIPERFVFAVRFPQYLQLSEVPQLVLEARKRLRSIGNFQSQVKLILPRKGKALELTVYGPSPRTYGYLGSMMSGGAFELKTADIASKISKKAQQLPKDAMGVVVVEPGDQAIDLDDIQDASYGSPVAHFDRKTAKFLGTSRSEKRVFLNGRNTRMGAVYYHEWSAGENGISTVEAVFHNPFAALPITPEFFQRPGVKQFLPHSPNEHTIEMRWLT